MINSGLRLRGPRKVQARQAEREAGLPRRRLRRCATQATTSATPATPATPASPASPASPAVLRRARRAHAWGQLQRGADLHRYSCSRGSLRPARLSLTTLSVLEASGAWMSRRSEVGATANQLTTGSAFASQAGFGLLRTASPLRRQATGTEPVVTASRPKLWSWAAGAGGDGLEAWAAWSSSSVGPSRCTRLTGSRP